MKNRILISVAVLTLVLFCSAAGVAKSPRISAMVTAGLFSENSPGWVPVKVRLENFTDQPIELTVTISVYSRWDFDEHNPEFTSQRHVTLSPGKNEPSRKVFYMYIYADGSYARYTIADEHGRPMLLEIATNPGGKTKEIYEKEVANLSISDSWRSDYNVVLIGEKPNALHGFDRSSFDFTPDKLSFFARYGSSGTLVAQGWVAYLEEGELPDTWIAYASADVIVLNGGDMENMATEEKQAIVDYVRMGGTLVISPPSKDWLVNDKNLVHDLIRIEGVREKRLADVREYAALVGTHSQGDTPYLDIKAAGARPVWVHESEVTSHLTGSRPNYEGFAQLVEINNGRVYILPFDLSHETYAQSGLATFFLQANVFREPEMISDPYGGSHHFGWGGRGYFDVGPFVKNELARSLDMSSLKLLPLWLVTIIAVVYVGLVAPANFLALRRWGRPLLFVASVPIIVVIYTGMIFVTGYVYKGSSNLYSEVEIVEATSGSGTGASERYSGIYSASPAGFALEYDGRTVPCPFFLTYAKQKSARIRFDNYPRVSVGDFPLSLWQMGYMGSRGPRDLAGGVRIEMVSGGCRVTNNTPYDLKQGLIAQTTGYPSGGPVEYYSFPGVRKGETVFVEFSHIGTRHCSHTDHLSHLLGYNIGDRDFPASAINACVYKRFEKAVDRTRDGEVVLVASFQDDGMPFQAGASMKKEFDAHFLIVRSTWFGR